MPLRNEDFHRMGEEQYSSTEYFGQQEINQSRENPSSAELFRSEERQASTAKPKATTNQAGAVNLRVLTTLSSSLAVVATTVVATVAILPPKVPLPTFSITAQEVGLDFFRGSLRTENVEGGLTVVLKDKEGQVLDEFSLNADGSFDFQDLAMGSEYVLSFADEEGVEHYAYTFETAPYVSLVEQEIGNRAKLVLHPTIQIGMGLDNAFHLWDSEGKNFSDNVFSEVITSGGDYESSDTSGAVEIIYYLNYDGLYTGEYTLQFISYLPGGGELSYERQLQLGDLAPLVYTPSVDSEAGQISLQYGAGDLGEYASFYVELYKNGEYYDYVDATLLPDGSMTMPIGETWESGSYTLCLVGIYGENAYNEIWKSEITL